jgi:hypothetical protein
MTRPARDPEGFDRDGKRTGPTHVGCIHCGVPPGGEHKMDCRMWSVRPLPVAKRERMLPAIREEAPWLNVTSLNTGRHRIS